jgi:hypothetical protein
MSGVLVKDLDPMVPNNVSWQKVLERDEIFKYDGLN